MNKGLPLRRLGLILALSIGFELFIIVRLASLQLFHHSEFRSELKHQSEVKVKVIPLRGRIYDRYYRILATSVDSKEVITSRVYPLRNLARSLLGFVGKDGNGLEGVEYEFDNLLSGKPGYRVLGKTPRGKLYPYPGYHESLPKFYGDLVLTIDADIQAIVEEALKARVKDMRANSGSAVVINPKNGEILAMATTPLCNPTRNRPLQDQFEPGSTFKVVPISLIIKDKLVALNDTVEDGSGKITIQGKTINDVHEHDALTFAEAVWKSSNVAFVKLANLIGREQFYNGIRFFGFGTPTGITLPGEARGSLLSPSNWSEITFANLAFGQGLSCNLLQLAFAYGVIANEGTLLKPIMVKEVLSSGGRVIYESEPIKVRQVLTPSSADSVKELLCGVIEKGTGILAQIPGIRVAGKTGTAQKCVDGEYGAVCISSFVGFFPAEDPKILIACIIDEPKPFKLGGQVCGPLFKEIAQKIIRLKSYKSCEM